MLSSLWRPFLLAALSTSSSSVSPLVFCEAVLAPDSGCRFHWGSPAGELLQKGILQHDREFQPPRYLRIGQLMVSAEHFSVGKPIQFELVVMAATLNTAVNFCQRANAWDGEAQKTRSPECHSRFWPQATENELKSSWLSPHTFFGIIFLCQRELEEERLSKNHHVWLWPLQWGSDDLPWNAAPLGAGVVVS